MRAAKNRSKSGDIVSSRFDTAYQLGLERQAATVALPQRCACRDGDRRQSQDTSATDLWIEPSIHLDGLDRSSVLQRRQCGVRTPVWWCVEEPVLRLDCR